jgi:membrane-bound lytic murein transglycosylase D
MTRFWTSRANGCPRCGGPPSRRRGGEADGALPTTTIVPTLLGAPDGTGGAHSYQFTLPPDDPLVQKYVALYKGPLKDRTQAALDRMALHQEMILKALRAEGLPEELLYLPIVESEYQPFAVSRAGAVGMWQFMPTTARYAGLKVNYWIDERRDPVKSTKAALKVLKSLFEWFDDWSLALAAYNRGMYGIQRDLEFTRSADFNALSKRQGIPKETEHYVPKMMAISLIAQDFKAHGLRAPDPRRRPAPDDVVLEKPLDLKVAAAAAKTTEDVIRELNPSVRLWCTPQNESQFVFRVPAGTKERFLEALAQIKDWTPSPGVVKYKVQRGDVLGRIAQKYRTTASAIQRDNKITNPNRVRPGQVLVIRPGRGFKGD